MDRRDPAKKPRPDMLWSEKHKMWVDPDTATVEQKKRREKIAAEYCERFGCKHDSDESSKEKK